MGAQGAAVLDFGAFPGANSASVDVTGQTGFVSASLAEAFVYPAATVEHSADEHRVEELRVDAVYQADGTIRIYGQHTGQGNRCPNGYRLYGRFNVGWVWA